MKINDITALDYQVQGTGLTLTLAETTLDAVAALDGALLEVRTDDGDLVEALAGYQMQRVTYDLAAERYTAELVRAARDNTAEAVARLAEALEAAKAQTAELAAEKAVQEAQIAALSEYQDFQDELIAEMAAMVYQ